MFQHSSLWRKNDVVPTSDGIDLKTSYGPGTLSISYNTDMEEQT